MHKVLVAKQSNNNLFFSFKVKKLMKSLKFIRKNTEIKLEFMCLNIDPTHLFQPEPYTTVYHPVMKLDSIVLKRLLAGIASFKIRNNK